MSGSEEEYEDEDQTVTPEEKKLIARLFICKSSAGESKDLADDLQSILGKDLLTDDLVKEYILDRSEKYYDFAKGEEIIVCEHSKQEDGTYKNPSTGETATFEVDKNGLKVGKKTEGTADEDPLREKLAKALKEHVKEHYLTELHATRVCAVYAKGDEYTCVISAKNTNLASYWTGNWQCTYKLTKGGKAINAHLKINIHYYEGGNVQLNVDKKEEIECECNADNTKTIIKKICEFENEFQTSISDYYAENQASFKKVRRGLTIQGTKFDWRLAIHENVKDMTN